MHSRQQSRLDPSPFIVRTVIGFRHSIAGQPPKQAASCSVRSAIVVFPEIASFILIVYENAARLLLRPQQLRQLGDVGGDAVRFKIYPKGAKSLVRRKGNLAHNGIRTAGCGKRGQNGFLRHGKGTGS